MEGGDKKKKKVVIPPLSNLLTPYISSRFSHPPHPTKGRTHRRWPHLHPSWHVPVGVHSCSGVHPRGAEALSGSSPLDRGPLCFRCHPPPPPPPCLSSCSGPQSPQWTALEKSGSTGWNLKVELKSSNSVATCNCLGY